MVYQFLKSTEEGIRTPLAFAQLQLRIKVSSGCPQLIALSKVEDNGCGGTTTLNVDILFSIIPVLRKILLFFEP